MYEGNGTPLQYSCPEDPMDGGALWAAVHGVAESQTQLGTHALIVQNVHNPGQYSATGPRTQPDNVPECSDSLSFIDLFVTHPLPTALQPFCY